MKKRILILFLVQAFLSGMLFSVPSANGGISVNGTCFVLFNDEDGFRIYSCKDFDSRKENQEKQSQGKEIIFQKYEDGFDKDTQVFFEKGLEYSFFFVLKKNSAQALLFNVKETGEVTCEKLFLSAEPDGIFVRFKNTFNGKLHIVFSSQEGIIEDVFSSKNFGYESSLKLIEEKVQPVSDFCFEAGNAFVFKNKDKVFLLKTCGFNSWETYEYKGDFSVFCADSESSSVYCAGQENGMLYVYELCSGGLKKVFSSFQIPPAQSAFIHNETFYFFYNQNDKKYFSACSKNGEVLFSESFTEFEFVVSGIKNYFLFKDGCFNIFSFSDDFNQKKFKDVFEDENILGSFENKIFFYSEGCINIFEITGSGFYKLNSFYISAQEKQISRLFQNSIKIFYNRKSRTYFLSEKNNILKLNLNQESADLIECDFSGFTEEENGFLFLYFIKDKNISFFKMED